MLSFLRRLRRGAGKRYCDVPGCGAQADRRSTGEEPDQRGLNRTALPKLNVCAHHEDWIFSDDARAAVEHNPDVYNARI